MSTHGLVLLERKNRLRFERYLDSRKTKRCANVSCDGHVEHDSGTEFCWRCDVGCPPYVLRSEERRAVEESDNEVRFERLLEVR